ncbi:MAG: hypothetical protein ACM3WV_01475 [Bacillota bacterium]
MKKALSDLFVAGTVFGILANIPKMILDIILYFSGFSRFFCFHVTGGVILTPEWFDSLHGYLVGGVLDYIFAAFLGASLAYFLYLLPGRYLFYKGIGFSIFIWLFLCIMVVEKASMWHLLTGPRHAYQTFLVHQLWGVIATSLLIRYNSVLKSKDQTGIIRSLI